MRERFIYVQTVALWLISQHEENNTVYRSAQICCLLHVHWTLVLEKYAKILRGEICIFKWKTKKTTFLVPVVKEILSVLWILFLQSDFSPVSLNINKFQFTVFHLWCEKQQNLL